MIDFIFPEIPEWYTAKKAIESGLIGKVLNITVNWKFLSYDLKNKIKSWKTDVEQGGGVLSFYFSHTFYYLEYFMGRIKNIQCTLSGSEKNMNNGETIIDMSMVFENECIGNAHMDISYTGQQTHTIEFQGEDGTMLLKNNSGDFVDNFELTVDNLEGTQKVTPIIGLDSPKNESEDSRVKVVKPIADRFIEWCNTGVLAKPDFQDGTRVQELIEMARASNSSPRNTNK